MAANGISTLATKELRQVAKLTLAETDRAQAGNPRSAYDIDLLPTVYSGNSVVDNTNLGGLVQGRPWVALQAGIYRRVYSGYFNDNVNYFTTPASSSVVTDIYDTSGEVPTTTSFQYTGYFKALTTETYTFYLASDDAGFMWIGQYAVRDYTTSNANINNAGLHGAIEKSSTVDLVAGAYYPIRVQFGNSGAGGVLEVNYSTPTITKNRLFTDCLFYNPITNGI